MLVTSTNIRMAQNQIDTLTTDNFELQVQIEQLTHAKELAEMAAEAEAKALNQANDHIDQLTKENQELKEMLGGAGRELHQLIGLHNSALKRGISSTDLDEPDYWDMESCYLIDKLLSIDPQIDDLIQRKIDDSQVS